MRPRTVPLACTVALALAVGADPQAVAAPGMEAAIIGQTASADIRLDGVGVPSGTTLISPAVVTAGASPAIVHLENGSVVAVLPESVARFLKDERGAVRVAVESGQVVYADALGEVVDLAAGAESVWAAREDQIGEGAATSEPQERLCELIDATPATFLLCTETDPDASQCAWRVLVVPVSEVADYVGSSAVYAGENRNDLGLDRDCREEAAGLGLPAKVGMGVGGAALAAYIIDEIEDEKPASPVRPQ